MLKKIIIVVVTLMFICFGYYTISPIFNTVTLNEEAPAVQSVSGSAEASIVATSYPVVGTVGHPAEGTVKIIESSDGKIVRYENFKTINGPDLFVYLSKDLDGKEFVNLGELRGTEGNINYMVPGEVDISEYRYVMTWCKQFGVLFNYADIGMKESITNKQSMEKSIQDSNDINKSTETLIPNTLRYQDNVVKEKTALLANGCFWCAEHDLEEVVGVTDVVAGYAGGSTENPTYANYVEGGHREVVLVTYDANKVTYGNLVEHIIKHGDPTDANGSFGDRGQQYAPSIYYENEAEKNEAYRVIHAVDALHVFSKPLPLMVIPTVKFWPAEDYHQNYSKKNPVRYKYYRTASGRNTFIEKYWGDSANTFVIPHSEKKNMQNGEIISKDGSWESFVKPSKETLRKILTAVQFEVTQENGTERAFTNAYDTNYDEGIYVDIISGEPLYLSKDKYDSGTGWPSFVKPITDDAVVLHEDNTFFTKRTEVRSRFANSHLGHVFDDGPADRGGKRYCMNSASLRFISRRNMEKEGYAYLFPLMNT